MDAPIVRQTTDDACGRIRFRDFAHADVVIKKRRFWPDDVRRETDDELMDRVHRVLNGREIVSVETLVRPRWDCEVFRVYYRERCC